jgi:hypothetical protein
MKAQYSRRLLIEVRLRHRIVWRSIKRWSKNKVGRFDREKREFVLTEFGVAVHERLTWRN